MKHAKGTAVPLFFPGCIPEQRDNALLRNAIKSFEAGHFADALIGAEYACRRFPDNPVPAILRARILQDSRPEFVTKAWYRAWFCEPGNAALQDAMLRAWLQSGARASVLELGPAFLPVRCRNRNEASLLDILRQAGMTRAGACWRNGEYIEGIVYQLVAQEPETAKTRLVLADETSGAMHEVETGALFRISCPSAGVWSLAFAGDSEARSDEQLLQGSPIVFPSQRQSLAVQKHSAKPKQKKRAHEPLDIIIPVYTGYAAVKACIDSVLASLAANTISAELVVIDDASPDTDLSAWLTALASASRITLLRNRHNLGFIETVNRGLRLHAQRDVILLNADTLVHGNWIDRLHASLYSSDDIASATPWSNNGEITSFPFIAEASMTPRAEQAAAIDRAAAELHQRGNTQDVELPSCCGFAMMIRRSVLDRIGLLDGVALTRGYGEEVDWCQRARAAGYRHLAATGVFIAHTGTVSFRFEKRLRVRQNRAVLAQRYPEYHPEYHAFLKSDPLSAARKALRAALAQQHDKWLADAMAKKNTESLPGTILPAPIPSGCARIAVWRHQLDDMHAGKILELARMLATRRIAARLLIIGEVSEALWHTGVVDALPIMQNTESSLLSDAAIIGLTGCDAVLAAPGRRPPPGIAAHEVDDGFRPGVWLANWLKEQHRRRTQAAGAAFNTETAAA